MTTHHQSLRSLLKVLATRILANSAVADLKLNSIRSSNVLTVLSLHSVTNHTENGYEALSPVLFDELLSWLKQRFNIITFAELDLAVEDKRPPLVLSFDDGYRDFYEIAMPILSQHKIKVNQNVIPDCIATGLPPINVLVQEFLLTAPAKLLSEIQIPGIPSGSSFDHRAPLALKVSATLKNMPIADQRNVIKKLMPEFERFDGFKSTPMMTREHVVEAARIHEIGMHSWEHASMKYESDEYLMQDAVRCKTFLGELGTLDSLVFAFPNGLFRAGQADVVHDAGFKHVLCVGENFSHSSNWLHNRFTFYGQTIFETHFRSLGGLRFPTRLNHYNGSNTNA